MSKRVLIITYYWPPSAGSGVQRWLKFAKYLPDFGWEPVIFTPENPDFELKDESLLKEIRPEMEVLKFPIWEPYGLFRKIKKQKLTDTAKVLEKKSKSITDKAGIWLRANALIPDPRRFWIKPSVEFLVELIEKGQFDALITTGPPHSLHLIGLQLKRKTGITWLADFRDPWSKWEFLDTLPMMDWVRKKHESLERDVLQKADSIITISPTFQKDFETLSGKNVELITNGFDTTDLPENWDSIKTTTQDIEILYTGVIDAIRNPIPFITAFRKVYVNHKSKVTLRFVGKVSENVKSFIASDPWLQKHVILEGYVSHGAVFTFYQKANLLLLILTDTKNAQGNIPGKLFEYIATGRPIIALGDPEGDSAKILGNSGSGIVFSHTDLDGIKNYLLDFKAKGEHSQYDSIEKYSRRNLTGQLAKLLDEKTNPIS